MSATAVGRPVTRPSDLPPEASWRSLVRETLWLMRARWRITVNALARGARWRRVTYLVVAAALAFLGLFALGVSWILTVGIRELTGQVVGKPDVIVATVLSGTLSLSVLISFTVALAALYLSADLDMLLAAPVDRRAVFASKLLGGLLPSFAVVLLMAVVPLTGHGIAMEYGRAYYLAALGALLLLPVLPIAVGSLAVMVIVRRVSARRLGDVVGLVVVAMTLSIAFVAGGARQLQEALTLRELIAVFEQVRVPWSPAEWLTRGVVAFARGDAATGVTWFALTGGLSAVALGLVGVLSGRLYYDGWMRLQSSDRRRELRESRLPWNRTDRAGDLARPSGLLAWLSPPAAAIVRKDFRTIPRDLTNMAQVLSPLAIGVFFVLQRLLYPVRLGGLDRVMRYVDPMLAMLSAGIAVGVAAMIMSRFTLTALSTEGRSYWLVKSAPVSQREVVGAKFLVAYLPYLALAAGLVVVLEAARAVSDVRAAGALSVVAVWQALDWLLLVYAWFVAAVVGAGVLAINLALGVARPNLHWDTPHEMLTPDLGCLSLVLYGGYGFVAGIALLLPPATSGFPMIAHPGPLWALGLAIGLGVTAVVVVTGLRLAIGEIDRVDAD
jgi:ABC-2 type transport system permease protein